MTTEHILFTAILSLLAYALGHWTGWKYSIVMLARAMARCGIRDFDSDTRTITFTDGTQHRADDYAAR